MLNSRGKHLLHCILLITVIICFELWTGAIKLTAETQKSFEFNPWERYGLFWASLLYLLRILTFLPFVQVMFNFFGLILYNAFPDKVVLKASPLLSPFICIRIVTRGDYPNLVRDNVSRNLELCNDAGMRNFMIEVVTDKAIGFPENRHVREVIVPVNYKTKTGALFKARALQYCLEDNVNLLSDHDWIVHLDEETLLTENSVHGILNFTLDGKHHFGQGLITYANEQVVNWITTLADSFRVADDMGKLRFQLSMLHKPVLSWKGSYVVTQVAAEKNVSFDNGLNGSVAEDCYFAMRAYAAGYSFNFVEGEMWEKSPFSLWDLMQQRKRWLQGVLLVVHSPEIPLKYKIWLAISCYSWVTLPLSSSNLFLSILFPIPCPSIIDFLCAFIGAVNIYMYIFGVIKSFSLYRFGIIRFTLCLIGSLCVIPLNVLIENAAVIWGLFGKKHRFYIVNKQLQPLLNV